ncbi:hypothetical protein JCM3770_004902 [Rhodotorula araucariae]
MCAASLFRFMLAALSARSTPTRFCFTRTQKAGFHVVAVAGASQDVPRKYGANEGRGGRYTYVLDLKTEDLAFLPASIHAERTLCATAYGEDADFSEKYFDLMGEWLDKGEFRAQKVTVIPGGLSGVKEGLWRLQDGEVRGEKLVYHISETPGLA